MFNNLSLFQIKYSDYVSVQNATAHPHIAPDNTVYNLGFHVQEGNLNYCILSMPEGRIEDAKIEASVKARWKLSPGYMHSFGMTENYFILAETPLSIEVLKMLLPMAIRPTVQNCMKFYKKEKTRFRVISRKTGSEVNTKYFAPGFAVFHFTNCYEVDGNIVVDLCRQPGNILHALDRTNFARPVDDCKRLIPDSSMTRFVLPVYNVTSKSFGVDLISSLSQARILKPNGESIRATAKKTGKGVIMLKGAQISSDVLELPRINYKYNMKPYKYAYCAGSTHANDFSDFDAVVKIDMNTGKSQIFEDQHYFVSEAMFVPSPKAIQEDDGVVLTLLIHKTDVKKLSLLVLDAKSMTEIARVTFEATGSVTSTFHGQFISRDEMYHTY